MGLEEYYNEDYNRTLEQDEQTGIATQKLFQEMLGNVEGKKILDVGCGTEAKMTPFVQTNEIVGLDLNRIAIKKAKNKGLRATFFDIEKRFPFADEEFDIVVCSQVLEHLLQPSKTVSEIYRVLSKDGLFFVDIPNHFTWRSRLRILVGGGDLNADHEEYWKGEYDSWNSPHIRFSTWTAFQEFLMHHNFIIVKNWSYVTVRPIPFFRLSRDPLVNKFPQIRAFLSKGLMAKHPSLFCKGSVLKCGSL